MNNNNKVFHNTIHGNATDGIRVLGDGALIRNNIITGSSGYGINVTTGSMVESHNVITDASTNPPNGFGPCNVALDGTDLNADPQYVDAAGGDFTLTECASPAINTGLDLGVDQPDLNGVAAGSFNGAAPDIGALETPCLAVTYSLAGIVFEDADFAGAASGWDGGVGDAGQPAVDVEVYTAADVFVATTTTDGAGAYSFSGLADGAYKVRVRSATLGDADTPPAGGLNASIPATWPYPLPEMTWANGVTQYGGQNATADDTDTGDDAGPGDAWSAVTVSGVDVTGVDFGFAYNLIVHTDDDGMGDASRSGQGSLRQFLKNANAIGTIGSTTANSSEFRMQVAANQSGGGQSWWRILPASTLPALADDGTTLDGSTQTDNQGDTNALGPEIEIHGSAAGVANGLTVTGGSNIISELTISGFAEVSMAGIVLDGAGALGIAVTGSYIGTDALGSSTLANFYGINLLNGPSASDIGGANPGDGNLISGNNSMGIYMASGSDDIRILGNQFGTDAAGDSALPNNSRAIYATSCSGIVIGGPGASEGNLVSGNLLYGIEIDGAGDVTIQGNRIGTNLAVTAPLGNGDRGVYIHGTVTSATIGGSASGEGNVISGNGNGGIFILAAIADAVVRGNMIGTGLAGTENGLGNLGSPGISLTSSAVAPNIVIGGLGPGEGNVVADNDDSGIIFVGTGIQVLGNEIRGNTLEGLNSGSSQAKIVGNLVVGNGTTQPGIYIGAAATDQEIHHNTVHGNGGDGIELHTTGALIHNNIISGNSSYGLNLVGGTMTESNNLVTGATTNQANVLGPSNVALDAGDLDADPLYVDALGGGFSLTECTSPAINAGLDLGVDQPDMNGVDPGNFNGPTPDLGALETTCVAASNSLSGRVFEDADFAGTASGWDGGAGDAGQPAVDVELYDGTDVYLASTTTDGAGAFSFTGLGDGLYKVRVRSATLGDADTPPTGGLNPSVPATWPYPLPELVWANGAVLYGGQAATVDDTDTGDDAGPGDTWVAVTISGAGVAGVDFGFTYNLIVHTGDDGMADASRSGQGSLRQFLKNANGITGVESSYFDIPVSDPGYVAPDQYWSIQPTVSALPTITDPIILDGYTQPGASPGTQGFPSAMNSVLKIEINGSLLGGSGATGITVSAGNSTIRGLAINSFTGAGAMGVNLAINGNNTIQGNFIGTDVSGTLDRGNDGYAVNLDTPDNLLGGAFAGAGNIISAGNSYGIWIAGSGNMIQGNLVGTDITGTQGLGHAASGIGVITGTNISIGGSASGSGNLISANGGNGIWFNSTPDIVTVQGNRIGTDITGTLDLGNSSNGVLVNSPNTTVGGLLPGEGNLISGNNGGITISSSAANTVVQGNLVGTDINGTGVLGNSGTGITVQTSDNMIGGTAAGAGNVIANSLVNNLTISSVATNVSILGNSIYAAGNLGIDLGNDGVTLNDFDDGDAGANNLQNFPVLDSVITDGSSTITISGTLISNSLTAYRIEIFSTSTANPSGFGEGEVYLGSVDRTTSDSGLATFSVALPVAVPAGHWISATATSPTGDTSEFGEAARAEIEMDLQIAKVVDNNAPNEGDTVTYTVTVSNAGPNDGTGITVTDLLPAGVTYVSDTPSQGTYVPATGLWSVGTITDQGSASLTLVATVDAGTGGSTITNNTSITAADQADPVAVNNTALADIDVQAIISSLIQVTAVPLEIFPILPGGLGAEVLRIELVNQGTQTETLKTLAVTNTTTGPGTMAELEGDWKSLSLMVDNNGSLNSPNTTGPGAVTTGIFSDNRLNFNGLAIMLAPGDTTRVVILGQASLGARDGDILAVEVEDTADLLYNGASQSIATWPLNSIGGLAVDGLVADQIGLNAVDPSLFNLLSTRNLALDFVLPANGYQSDQLHRLNIINTGTAMPLTDISRLECWGDEGDDQFNPAADILLGEFAFTGSRWELTGLGLVIPQAGQRVFVTVDIAETALEGRTIQLGLPTNLDVGIGMASENDGPIDREVVNPFMQAVSTADRVILSTGNIVPGTVAPGEIEIPLLHLVALNSYTVDRRLVALTVNNGTEGMGAPGEAERDAELDYLKLRIDGNGDGMLGNLVDDPVLASGRFQSGSVTFSGLVWNLAAGVSSHLFITGDVSLSAAADMDVISVHMDGGADLTFENDVVLSASWPLDSGARWTIDGLVAAQVVNTAAPSLTLAAGEGPVLVLDLVLPSNGYADDTLTGLKLVNRGTAIGEDIAGLNLWRDGGDGIFSSGGGDDVDLGPFVLMTDTWLSPVLDTVLPVGGMRFFVGMTVAPSPTNSATVRMAVPVHGITVVSENDGPVDQSIEAEGTFLLSSAPLLAEIHFDQEVSTVGQTVTVTMQLRNVGTENLIGISPQALILQGDGVLTLVGGPTPASFDLAPDAANSFSWSYTAGGVGVVSLSGLAEGVGEVSGRTWPSVVTYSGPHEILEPASSLELFAVGNLPFTINRGQTDVVPLTLTFVNPGGENRSDALIRSLRIRLRDDAGLGVVPAELLTRVVVNEGGEIYLEKDVLENSGDEILLTLNSPVCVTSLEPVTLGIRLDVRADAMVPAFIVEIGSADWFVATGAISNDPVTILLQEAVYPIQSGLLSLLFDATRLDVAAAQVVPQQVGESQQDVDMLTLQLLNPGEAGLGSDIRVGSIAFSLTDTLGAPIATPSAYLNRLRVENSLQALLDVSVADHDSSIFTLEFTSPLSVPVDTPLDLHIVADIAAAVSGAVRMNLADASLFQTLDGNSGHPVPVVYASDPVAGAPVVIQQAASGIMAQGTPLLPSDLVIGTLQVEALEISLRHPGAATEADIQVAALVVNCRNEDRDSLAPAGIIDVLEILRDGAPVGSIGNPTGDGEIIIPLNGIMLQPGQTVILTLSLDLEASAAPGSLELIVAGVGIDARDQNLGLPVPAQPESGEEFPLTSGLTRLQDSADELRVDFVSFMPAVLVDSPAEVPMAKIVLRNPNPDGVSGISVSGLTIRAADDLYRSLPIGEVAGEIILYRGSEIWAHSGALDPADTLAVLQAVETEFIGSAREVELEMLAVLRSPSAGTAFCLGIQENDVKIIQPAGSLVTVRVEPEDGQFFPYWTEIGSFSAASLAASYSNFPNPFAAGSEQTTFVFALDRPATVSLRLLTAHARPVQNIITEEYRSAGLYQQDKWDGRNGNGVVIQNGVYIAELTVVYEDGTKDRQMRKVAIVR